MHPRLDPARVEHQLWRTLGRVARAGGLVPSALLVTERILPGRHDALRLPLVHRALRRDASTGAILLRLFVYDDEVEEARVAEVLGADLTTRLLEHGVLRRAGTDGALTSAVRLTPFDEALVVSDDLFGVDPVIPPGPTTLDLLRCVPRHLEGRRVLDLGCGPGSLAAVCAGRGAQVVATDLSARACELAVATSFASDRPFDVRESDGVEGVRELRFDHVLCQPPFVPRVAERTATYLQGGSRGDELAWRLFREAVPLLSEDGTILFRMDLAGTPEEIAAQLVRDVPTSSFLAFVAPGPGADELSMAYATAHARAIDASVAAEARSYADAFEAAGIARMGQALVVGWRGPDTMRAVRLVPSLSGVDAEHVARVRAGLERTELADAVLARVTASMPRGACLTTRTTLADRKSRILLEAPGASPTELSEPVALLLDVIAQGASFEEAADALARAIERPFEEALEATLRFARDALRKGLLEVE